MNIGLKKVIDYCIINKLSVNMKKTNYMLNTPNTNKQIDINIRDIERKSCIKYVGTLLSILIGTVKLHMLKIN